MPSKYRIWGKELCPMCLDAKARGEIRKNCNSCRFFTYHSNDLLSTTAFIDKQYPNWVWFKVYDGKAPRTGQKELATFKNTYKVFKYENGKRVFSHTQRDVPTRRFL